MSTYRMNITCPECGHTSDVVEDFPEQYTQEQLDAAVRAERERCLDHVTARRCTCGRDWCEHIEMANQTMSRILTGEPGLARAHGKDGGGG